MKILLTGARGQLGRHLAPLLVELGVVVDTARSPDRDERCIGCDLADPAAVDRLLNHTDPDVIVNTAAWTDVDGAEARPEPAMRLNRDLPGQLAEWCVRRDRRLLHFSTDYVFNGTGAVPLVEDMATDPVNCYGRSKLAGEQAIARSGARAVVLRTSWVYSALAGNFFTAVFNRARQGKVLQVVDDQVGNPTWAGALARAAAHCLEKWQAGPLPGSVYHVSCRGAMSWYGFARMALGRCFEQGLLEHPPRIEAIDSAQWVQPARRPAWSVLDCHRFESELDYTMPEVSSAFEQCLASGGPVAGAGHP